MVQEQPLGDRGLLSALLHQTSLRGRRARTIPDDHSRHLIDFSGGSGAGDGAGREPASAPKPSTERYSQLNDPSSRNLNSSQPCVSANRLAMKGGSEVNSRRGTPPVETWKAVIPSATQASRLSTGKDRS